MLSSAACAPTTRSIPRVFRVSITRLPSTAELGRAPLIRDGKDLLIVAMGSVSNQCVAAAKALSEAGVEAGVVVVSSLNPAPADDLAAMLARYPLVLTVEEHYRVGGVGSLVSEIVAETALPCRVVRCAVETGPDGVSGSHGFFLHKHGLTAEALVETASRTLSESAR